MNNRTNIQRIRLFASLTSGAQDRLAATSRTRAYEDGQLLLLEGDQDSPVFFVVQGAVRVFHANPEGREQTVIFLQQGEGFNMPAAFSQAHRAPASAMAVGQVKALLVGRRDFQRLATTVPEIALAVLSDFSDKLYHLTGLAYNLSLRSVRARLARFLLDHVQVPQATPIRWTHEEIASQIGTVREVVSRTLQSFSQRGLIQMARQRIVIVDRDELDQEAQ